MIMNATIAEYSDLLEALLPAYDKLSLFPPSAAGGGEGIIRSDVFLQGDALPEDEVAIVAVIDHVVPFAHHLLTAADGHSRVASIWLQDGVADLSPRPDIAFGLELRGSEIDLLRQGGNGHPRSEEEIYRAIGLMEPGRRDARWMMRASSHGAAVACTAAGFLPDDRAGRAHPLIAVGLPDWALADTSGAVMPLLLQASVVFIISRARMLAAEINADRAQRGKPPVRPPIVVNISLGITAGPRDGTSLIERMHDVISAQPPSDLGQVHFVLASGNTRQRRQNAVLKAGADAPGEIGWNLPPDDRTISELQIWAPVLPAGAPAIRLRLTLPGAASAPARSIETAFDDPVGAGAQIAMILDDQERELARLVLQAFARGDRLRQCLTMIVPPTASDKPGPVLSPPGTWQIELLPGGPSPCDVVVQRDDRLFGFPRAGRQSWLVDPTYVERDAHGHWQAADPADPSAIRRNGTANAYAWGERQLRVGAHYRIGPWHADDGPTRRLSSYAGLLANGDCGDLTAAGDRCVALPGVPAPGLRGRATQIVSGTSIAAPRITRWLAARMAGSTPPMTRSQIVTAAKNGPGNPAGVPFVDIPMPWDR
ncbi:hypothetical protein [Paracoccus laeviglucosivorans]|uniref:Subtilase family protein n=1 Tax=Paracoccus laeviglucosivorans TaxID=1197861 RepID=A0A521C1U4_9RHOB|nr:hypothetical protein [Paracoccus laeviglucosivorans]SMO53358.1 hypothetical protein SAMN06265221_103346 [Paracoccus laeviglucosivorans]